MTKATIKFYCNGLPFNLSEYYKAENHWRYGGGDYHLFRAVYGTYKQFNLND